MIFISISFFPVLFLPNTGLVTWRMKPRKQEQETRPERKAEK